MKKFLILFASDMHGNEEQYRRIFKLAKKYDALILGGDICPKDTKRRTPRGQKEFLRKVFIPLCRTISQKNRCAVYVMLGNDDFKSNLRFLIRQSIRNGKKIYTVISNTIVQLNEDFALGGYAYVPPTPFIYKDWERKEQQQYHRRCRYDGVISIGKTLRAYNIRQRKITIAEELNKVFKKDLHKTILVTHTPPYQSKLDHISKKEHVGSKDIRRFIEEKQPYLTLHGHIHETVQISGQFKQKIKGTLCASTGNDHKLKKPFVLSFNVYEREKIKRRQI